MGQWSMHIEGQGIHDNGREDDADTMLNQFVNHLRKHHTITHTSMTIGSTRQFPADAPPPTGE